MKQIATAASLWALCSISVGAQIPVQAEESQEPIAAIAPPPETVPPVSSLFRDLVQDVRRLPRIEHAVVLGIASGLSAGLTRYDRSITSRTAASLALDGVFEAGEVLGGGTLQVGAALATYVVGRALHHPAVATVGADLVRAQILNTVLTQGIKFSVGRVRPDGGRHSFPSGHSSSSFALAAVLGRHFGWKVALPSYGAAAYVAASRLQENRHFPSDVVFGAAIGVVAGRSVTIGPRNARFVVSPAVSGDARGVLFNVDRAPLRRRAPTVNRHFGRVAEQVDSLGMNAQHLEARSLRNIGN